MSELTSLMPAIIMAATALYGAVRGVDVFEAMAAGVMDGLRVVVKIFPSLVALLTAVYMLRASGVLDALTRLLSPVLGDINRLRQVFVNIIDNALKYTDTGGTISVSAGEADGYIRVVISDNGCGIPAEHMPNIKKKFYKANQTIRGSGIGLALADEIMALHSGSLDIESHEGIGTAVTITIPTIDHIEAAKVSGSTGDSAAQEERK